MKAPRIGWPATIALVAAACPLLYLFLGLVHKGWAQSSHIKIANEMRDSLSAQHPKLLVRASGGYESIQIDLRGELTDKLRNEIKGWLVDEMNRRQSRTPLFVSFDGEEVHGHWLDDPTERKWRAVK
jgi:hypothetical protein